MNLERYTHKAREAVLQARELAEDYHHDVIDPEHLLLALLTQSEGVVPQIVHKLGGNPGSIISVIEQKLQPRHQVYGAAVQVKINLTRSPRSRQGVRRNRLAPIKGHDLCRRCYRTLIDRINAAERAAAARPRGPDQSPDDPGSPAPDTSAPGSPGE